MKKENSIQLHQRELKKNPLMALTTTLIICLMVLLAPLPVFAANINVKPMTDGIKNLYTVLMGFGPPIGILIFVIAGLALMAGQQGRQWAKPTMLFTSIGLGITILAPKLVDALKLSFSAA